MVLNQQKSLPDGWAADSGFKPMSGWKNPADEQPDLIDMECHAAQQPEANRSGKVSGEVEKGDLFDTEASSFKLVPETAARLAAEMTDERRGLSRFDSLVWQYLRRLRESAH